jgi:hypothetical protein
VLTSDLLHSSRHVTSLAVALICVLCAVSVMGCAPSDPGRRSIAWSTPKEGQATLYLSRCGDDVEPAAINYWYTDASGTKTEERVTTEPPLTNGEGFALSSRGGLWVVALNKEFKTETPIGMQIADPSGTMVWQGAIYLRPEDVGESGFSKLMVFEPLQIDKTDESDLQSLNCFG